MRLFTGFSGLALTLALFSNSVTAAPILSNAVAIQPVSAIATTNFGAPYTVDKTYNQAGLSANYVSGVTAASFIDSITATDYQQVWHGQSNVQQGSLTYDLGASYTLDRLFLFWANSGGTNNIANFNIDVGTDASFSSFVTAAVFGTPNAPMNRVDFASLATGQFVRLSWNSLQGSYPGLNEFVAGGITATASNNVPEPGLWALLAIGLLGLTMRQGKRA